MTTITQQRQRWNAVPGRPAIRLRSQWGAARPYTDAREVTEPATRLFVHITVTNPANYKGNDAHAQAVERIGISRFPNTGISYNFGIMPDGTLYEFQPVGRRGAHTVNDFKRSTCSTTGCPGRGSSLTAPSWNLNYNARAIVFCGVESTDVSAVVVEKFALTVYTCYKAGFITKAAAQHIHGHRCVSSKACPGNKMWAKMGTIQTRVDKLIAVPPGGGTVSTAGPEKWDSADWTAFRRGYMAMVVNHPVRKGEDGKDASTSMGSALRWWLWAPIDVIVARVVGLEALLAQLIAQGANDLTEQKVRDIIEGAIIKVDVTVTGTEEIAEG
jgi:hypothetical protein